MNRTLLFPALAFGGGGLAYILRLMHNRTGFESSGLPIAGNLWAILLPALLALILAAALILIGRIRAPKGEFSCFEDAFFSFRAGFLLLLTAGIFLLAISGALQIATNLGLLPDTVVLTASGFRGRSLSTDTTALISGGMTLLCAVCLFPSLSACRCSPPKDSDSTDASSDTLGVSLLIPVITMVVQLVLRYRQDSVNPTLAAYYPAMLALILATMALYLLVGFAFQSGNSRAFVLWSTMAVVLCISALADAQPLYSIFFYAGLSLTLAGYLCLHTGHLHMK